MNENELNGINNGNNTVSNETPVQSVVQETEEMPVNPGQDINPANNEFNPIANENINSGQNINAENMKPISEMTPQDNMMGETTPVSEQNMTSMNQGETQNMTEMPTNAPAVSTSPTSEGNINQNVTSTEGVQNPQMMNSNGTVSTEVGQEVKEPHVVKQKKQSNWVFIITVFAVVGIFVLLMPLLIRIFGY